MERDRDRRNSEKQVIPPFESKPDRIHPAPPVHAGMTKAKAGKQKGTKGDIFLS